MYALLLTKTLILNCRGFSWEQEYAFTDKYMCNLACHNTRCYEDTWYFCWTWACVRWTTLENIEATWENKDKVALLQKRNVDPKCKLGTCNPVNFTIFNLRDPKWKKGHQINICINGRGSDSRTVLIFRSFLFHSGFPHTGSSIPFMKRQKVAPLLFQPRLKICF